MGPSNKVRQSSDMRESLERILKQISSSDLNLSVRIRKEMDADASYISLSDFVFLSLSLIIE